MVKFLALLWNLQGSHCIFPKKELGQGFSWGLSAVLGSQEQHRDGASWCLHRKEAGKGTPASLVNVWLWGALPLYRAPSPQAPPHSLSHSVSRVPTSMMFSCSTLEATLNSGPLWWYRPSATQKTH